MFVILAISRFKPFYVEIPNLARRPKRTNHSLQAMISSDLA